MTIDSSKLPIGQKIMLPGHFDQAVILEGVRLLGKGFECRVRLPDGSLDETVISEEEAHILVGNNGNETTTTTPADAEQVRLLIESTRIRLAYTHDPHFAVSLSGIRTLPHQIEAVYLKMLPQPRLRFLLADDPGAGKTIMAGLLIKELKLREAIERILIICPSPLTIQWQDEMLRWFGEAFDIIFSAVDQQQLTNPWQRSNQVVASMDYAKQDDVRERVWQQRWDLVIIDEAHKCSAYTKKSSTRGDEAEKTKRYQLAEKLTAQADHVVLLTATPHHGDDDRFAHFIRLLDPDLFPEPHRMADKAGEIRRNILRLGPDCPWALRRLKEDLKDLNGHRLFPDRFAHTVAFRLNREEYDLYKAVTAYINEFLPQASGRKKQSVALARTVFQRRLASSTMAIHQSLFRRLDKQKTLLAELEALSPIQRAKHLAQLQGRLTDAEQEEDDLDEAQRDLLVDETTSALELDQLRTEIAALNEVLARAKRLKDKGPEADSKLAALQECLKKAEFHELKDGRGKLLIFTEHRDTMNHLREHLDKWGYSTCEIHGGMNPHERKRAQEDFRVSRQVCVATEAAGEGINLQFCHLMVNYDLPWNPTRLEQRLGRIHRIGQTLECHAFNFVAAESEEGQPIIEGRILQRLLEKLEQMRAVLADRVFDVIGEVLSLNDVNLPEMLREAAHDPRRLDEYLDLIEKVDPSRLMRYEQATGIALARANVDFSGFQKANVEAEERRLMPSYVEDQFVKASKEIGLKVEPRADGLWRVEHVLADLRSERLETVRRMGKPEPSYRKITFHKSHLEQDQHVDAILLGPGHPLYSAVDEKLNKRLAPLSGATAVYIDSVAESPYLLHFFEISIRGQNTKGVSQALYGELVAVREEVRGTGVPPVDHGQDAHATGFNPYAEIQRRHGAYLPHWTQDGATFAVNFRLADSLPAAVLQQWDAERRDIVATARQMNRDLTEDERQRLDQLHSEKVEAWLDSGHGECYLRDERIAQVVTNALRHFEGRRYDLVAWCIMPNHVHVILRTHAGQDLSAVLHSWKSFTAKEANRILCRQGEFWQPEYYDHLIRDEQDFRNQVRYVLENPAKAGLTDWKWCGPGTGGDTGVPPVEDHGQDAHATGCFSVVPTDVLLDLPAAPGYGTAQAGLPVHPSPPDTVHRFDSGPAADFLKSTYQTERRETCQKERQHFVGVCRDYLEQSFTARIHAAQNRVMSLRAREATAAEIALARQRAENDLADLQRTRQERLEGLKRLEVARHGPLRHLATAVVLSVARASSPWFPEDLNVPTNLLDDLDPETKRRSELAAEDVVIAHETGRGWEIEKVGHLKIGFDIRSLGPADAQTGYRDPVAGVRRIEVKGRMAGQPIRLTTNEWYKAQQLGDSFWLYVVWNPLNNPNSVPVMIRNPAKHLEHAAKPVVSARFYDIPADAIQLVATRGIGEHS